jgi:hypothetical protein
LHPDPIFQAMVRVVMMTVPFVAAHEYMMVPPSRAGTALLNAVATGTQICKTDDGADKQCPEDPVSWQRLFHLHPAYDNNACGGSPQISGWNMAAEGTSETNPEKFDMTVEGPESTTTWTAGTEVDVHVHGFFHEGVNRLAMCFKEDASCNHPSDFEKYVLAFHFTEGTAGTGGDIYSADLPFKVKLPNRNGKAVLQWLVDAADVRSYVSCSDVELTGADPAGPPSDEYVCNGHPLCNCTTAIEPTLGAVGLNGACPRGTAPSVSQGQATGTDIVKQYKEQVGVSEFCGLCLANGCPSTCGGIYDGFYQGPTCSNDPVLPGCGSSHSSALPAYVNCKPGECTSSGWTVSSPSVVAV